MIRYDCAADYRPSQSPSQPSPTLWWLASHLPAGATIGILQGWPTVPPNVDTGTLMVTKDNVAQFC